MSRFWVVKLSLWTTLVLTVASGSSLQAQPVETDVTRELLLSLRRELQELREQVDRRLKEVESRLERLEGVQGESEPTEELLAEAAASLAPEAPSPSPPTPTASALNPQISVIGDFLAGASWDTPDASAPPSLDLREVEIAFQSRIDPFARADFYVTIPSLEAVEIEEGFVSFLTLPSDFLVRLGKVRVPFGRENTDHRPETITVDRPDVIRSYFGEEGLSEMGVTVSRLVPNPWDAFMELELDVLDGANERSFGGGSIGDLLYNLRYRSYFDFTRESNLTIGASYANGVNEVVDSDRFRTQIFGLDATYQWHPLRQGAYRSLLWQTELMTGRRDTPAGPVDTWGFYSLARYQLGRRFYVGGRVDRSQDSENADSELRALTTFVEFFPSEFQRFRVQYRHAVPREGGSADQLFFQWFYLIGSHGAHRF